MRCRRIRYDREDCYYHLMNRIAGEPGQYPFGPVEKETFFRLALDLSRFYSLRDQGTGSFVLASPRQ